jgi:N-acetyl sugar amidotransferase
MSGEYKICKRCIMDTTDPNIQFDKDGVCNHCRNYEERARKELHYDEAGRQMLNRLIDKIKQEGKDKKHDCIIGLSGGTDSSTVAYNVKKLGLRPLAITVDNGWNDPLADRNVKNIVERLDLPLRTYTVDWEEFKDVQLSFLKASVANCEIPTDHIIIALLYRTAAKEGTPYIISGGNIVTEATMPISWGYYGRDFKHIKGIHKRFGKQKLKTFPHLTLFDWVYYTFVKGIKFIPILNYIPYNRQRAKELLKKELGWDDYGPKHFESIYTRFFQAYILPTKFGFDKRRAHLSTLICSGQISRQEALEEMKRSPYPTDELMKKDKEYVIEKLGLTKEEFEEIMRQPVKSYKDYPNNEFLYNRFDFIVKLAHKLATHN